MNQKNTHTGFGKSTGAFLLSMLLILMLSSCSNYYEPEKQATEGILQVLFLDVEQGDSTLLISPSGKSMLVDCGEGKAFGKVTDTLTQYGIKKPDVVIGSHSHSDHVGSLPGILKKNGANEIYFNTEKNDSRLYQSILSQAQSNGLVAKTALAGDKIPWDSQVSVEVLGPKSSQNKNLNNNSIVLKVSYGKHSFLLTADAEKELEEEMVREKAKALKATVVKIPHHGSKSSSTPAFVDAVDADVAICSYGENDFGHPNAEVLKRWQKSGAGIYTTKENGDLLFESDGERLWISGQKSVEAYPTVA